MMARAIVVWLVLLPFAGVSQVVSLTLGFDVNSPYGLSEPWYTIRNGLLRSDDLQTVAERPDAKTATAEVTTKAGALPDLDKLQKAITESGGGATLRGVEAVLDGDVISRDGQLLLCFSGNEIPLRPLTGLVHQEKKKPKPATADELNAHRRLLRKASEAKRWRVTGPLRSNSGLALEVRNFDKLKTK